VTYYLPEGPQPGRAGLETLWGGVAWRFSSEANLAAFKANPTEYAPRIGGYDAHAASLGRVVDSRPDIYLIREDRLYLFRTDAGRARFQADPSLASRSEETWLTLRAGLVRP
jgi:YHS domain-containing protein